MVSREMLFTWSALVTFLGLVSAASIVPNDAIREGDSVIVKDFIKNVTVENVTNCTKSDYEENVSFDGTIERDEKDTPISKSVEYDSFLPLPISVISDSIEIPVTNTLISNTEKIIPIVSSINSENQVGNENTKFNPSSISTKLLPPKETFIHCSNITSLSEGENYTYIPSNTSKNTDFSETTPYQEIVSHQILTENKSLNTPNALDSVYNVLQKNAQKLDVITAINETTFNKSSHDININTNMSIQSYDGSHIHNTSSNSELNNTESITILSETTRQPTDKLYTNAPLDSGVMTNLQTNILSTDLEQPTVLIEKMRIMTDRKSSNKENISSEITESNSIHKTNQNTSRPCAPLDQKYPIASVIAPIDNYNPLNLQLLPNVPSTESLNINITENIRTENVNIDTDNHSNENLFSEIIKKTSKSLSNTDFDPLLGTYFSKTNLNKTADLLPISITASNGDIVSITGQDQIREEYNADVMQSSAITTNNAINVDRNIEYDDFQSTETTNYITTSSVNEEILSSVSTMPTLYDSDIMLTEFFGTTTEVIIPEPLILSVDHKNSDVLSLTNLRDGQDDLNEIKYLSTTELLHDTESTSINIATDASTETSNLFTGLFMEQETESKTLLPINIDTNFLELNTSNDESSTTASSSFSNDEQSESTSLERSEITGNFKTDSTEDYTFITSSDFIDEKEVNTKPSLLSKQEIIINNPISITQIKLPENTSTNLTNNNLATLIMSNIFTKHYRNNKDENIITSSISNTNYNDPLLRKESESNSQLPILITTQTIDQSTQMDVTDWHSQSTFSDELISTTESVLNTKTPYYGEYKNLMEENSSTIKTQTSINRSVHNKLNPAISDERLTTNVDFQTVNSVQSETSSKPPQKHFMKTLYLPQQRDYLQIPVAIIYDEEIIKKTPSKNIIKTQRKFTDSKILDIQRNGEATKKHRYVVNRERGHIKYADTVTHSFYESITSVPTFQRIQNVRKLSDTAIIQNTEKTNTKQNLANKIEQKNYTLENISVEVRQYSKNNRSQILDKSVHKRRRGNIRHRGNKGITKSNENFENTNNSHEEESSRVKSNIFNINDVNSKPNANETNQENLVPKVIFLESSFKIPEQILTINNNNMHSAKNTIQLNKLNDIKSQVMLQNQKIYPLIQEKNPIPLSESIDAETMVEGEEFDIKTTVSEIQKMTTLSPLIIRNSKNAGFINNINLKDRITTNVEEVKDEILQFDVHEKNKFKIAANTEPASLDENLDISLLKELENNLKNEANGINTNGTKTYKLEATGIADIINTSNNDKNYYNNTKFISKQGNYFSSVYNSETLRKHADIGIAHNFDLEKQQDRKQLVNEESVSNSNITSKSVPDITIGAENSTNNIITTQVELKTNSSIEDIATTQFVSLEETTTVENFPTVFTTSVPIMKRKRKRRPIRKSTRKFHAVSAERNDNLEIRNDNNSISRIIRSTTTKNENHKPYTRMRDPIVPIINSENKVYAHTGHFVYSYESGDGTQAFETGDLKNTDETHTGEAVQGGFSYKDKDGQHFSLEYTADENGYRPRGAHLPTPPPIPPAIARALEYLATKTTPEPPTTTKSPAKT